MIVMVVAVIVMTTLVIQQSKWNNRLAVNVQAYELALMIRQAQIYGLGVREYASGTGDKFDVGYGVHLDSSSNLNYIFFADSDKDQKYDVGEELETKTLSRGIVVEKFCGYNGGSSNERCSPQFGVEKLDITFYRPEPKANIQILNSGGNPPGSVNPPAIIYLVSPAGDRATVKVESNGQVAIGQ
jgi:hypothetical protein